MKINNLSLSIDSSRMFNDLILKMVIALEETADELISEMRFRAKTDVVSNSIKKHLVWKSFNDIEYLVGSDHWKSFLDNYGTGSLMANSSKNPYLDEYKSKYWHSSRSNHAVTGRAKGSYTIPNFENGDSYITRYSKGTLKGKNLEKVKFGQNKGLQFKPQRPSFFIENSMKIIEKRFKDKIMEVYEHFPFYKYLNGGI